MKLHTHTSGPRDHAARGSVCFIHGFPFHGAMWAPQLQGLPDGWRGLAPDLRGFGRSPLDAESGDMPSGNRLGGGVARLDEPVLTMTRLADDVADLIRTESDEPVVVCGLSMGGYVAFELLRRRPEVVRGLVLADTRATSDSDEGRENRMRMAHTVRTEGVGPIADDMLPKLLAPATLENDDAVTDAVRRMILETPAPTVIAALAGMAARRDSTDDLPTIPVPTLVLVGENDAITPPDVARAMADAIPDAELAVIPGAGHLCGMENPAAFNEVLTAYLSRL